LLERDVPLESLPTVEAVTPLSHPQERAREKGVSRLKINVAEQTMPSASTSKTV